MKSLGIFNHVLGPVMRGPSSSHTAGAYHIASMARSLAGGPVKRVVIAFDPQGSYVRTYAPQGADRAFAMGFLGKPLTDESFFSALEDAPDAGLELKFVKRRLQRPDHPNAMEIEIERTVPPALLLEARSIGGGDVEFTRLDGFPISFNGSAFEILIEAGGDAVPSLQVLLNADGALLGDPQVVSAAERLAVTARRSKAMDPEMRRAVAGMLPDSIIFESAPVYYVQTGDPLFTSAAGLLRLAEPRAGPWDRRPSNMNAGFWGCGARTPSPKCFAVSTSWPQRRSGDWIRVSAACNCWPPARAPFFAPKRKAA